MASDSPSGKDRDAQAAAQLKETEDLLAGFDRPGRTPEPPAVRRDFVEHYLNRRPSTREASAARIASDQKRREAETVLVRERRRAPPWIAWAALLTAMTGLGTVFAGLAFKRLSSAQGSASSALAASAAEPPSSSSAHARGASSHERAPDATPAAPAPSDAPPAASATKSPNRRTDERTRTPGPAGSAVRRSDLDYNL